jgi:hypothetical protein
MVERGYLLSKVTAWRGEIQALLCRRNTSYIVSVIRERGADVQQSRFNEMELKL